MNKGNKLAVVFASVGIRSNAFIGCIKYFQEHNIAVDHIYATSGGAIQGAQFALGYPWKKQRNISKILWKSSLFFDPNERNYKDLLKRGFIVKGHNIRRAFYIIYGKKKFRDTKIPLTIIATDLKKRKPVRIENGFLTDAIRASISMPFILPHWTIKKQVFTDGGATDPLPIGEAINDGYENIIAFDIQDVGFKGFFARWTFIGIISRILRLYNRFKFTVIAKRKKIHLSIVTIENDTGLTFKNVQGIDRLIDLAEKATKRHFCNADEKDFVKEKIVDSDEELVPKPA